MLARPWVGLRRGLWFFLCRLFTRRAAHNSNTSSAPQAWEAAAQARRRVLLAMTVLLAGIATILGDAAGVDSITLLVLMTLLFAWVGVGLITALMGAWVMLRGDAHGLRLDSPNAPIHEGARTALVMPICNEDIATVFGGLRATCESLAATGALPLFDIYILSDTSNPALQAAEVNAWRELRASLGDHPDAPQGRVFYRWRRRRTERKAGNVADFCRRWGSLYRYMVVLDADSTMHGQTLVKLVRLMEQNPRVGIAQTLPQPVGHDTLHARAQQFGARVTGRLFALGMAYWQLGDSHYWGHNAILRVQPFMNHCRMAHLPGRGGLSGPILSHDFVEAAMMRRAGYEVWVVPQLGGSWEQTPPNLLDELQRDRRWCQGNLQNARLIAEPGWTGAHRVMFATGAFSYAVAPMWLALVASGVLATGGGSDGSLLASSVLWALTVTLLLLPRALGVGAVLLSGQQAQYGGAVKLMASSLLEAGLSALQAPVRMLAHTAFVLGALTGLRLEWRSPPRDARAVRFGDALARLGVVTLPALALAALYLPQHGMAWPWWPVLLPIALAVPMAVATGSETLGAWVARRFGLMRVPEEISPPRTLTRAGSTLAFDALQPRLPAPVAARPALSWPQLAWGPIAAAVLWAALPPQTALSPDLQTAPGLAPWVQAAASQRSPSAAQILRAADDDSIAYAAVDVNTPRAPSRVLPNRPARYIDDAVRRRALRAVESALASET
jgi:membrane glycosyltransferase